MGNFSKLIAAVTLASATPAFAQGPELKAAPPASAALTMKAGLTPLANGSYAYRPKSVSGPAPLIVLLPEGAQEPRAFLNEFVEEADKRGAILVSVEAEERAWTLKPDAARGADFGTGPARIDAAMNAVFAQAPIDPKRIVLLGYSHGGSQALSVGLANYKLFHGVVAMSLATAWLPPTIDRNQKLFIIHGRRDDEFPIRNVQKNIVPGLEAAGLKPQVKWFNGEHELDPRSIGEALDYVLAP